MTRRPPLLMKCDVSMMFMTIMLVMPFFHLLFLFIYGLQCYTFVLRICFGPITGEQFAGAVDARARPPRQRRGEGSPPRVAWARRQGGRSAVKGRTSRRSESRAASGGAPLCSWAYGRSARKACPWSLGWRRSEEVGSVMMNFLALFQLQATHRCEMEQQWAIHKCLAQGMLSVVI